MNRRELFAAIVGVGVGALAKSKLSLYARCRAMGPMDKPARHAATRIQEHVKGQGVTVHYLQEGQLLKLSDGEFATAWGVPSDSNCTPVMTQKVCPETGKCRNEAL